MAIQKHILDKLRRLSRLLVVFFEKHPIWSFLFLLALLIFFAGGNGENDFTWKEEVQLSTGEIIWVERYAHFETFGGHFSAPGGYDVKEMSLEVLDGYLDNPPPKWIGESAPVVFDIDVDSGEWFLIATGYSSDFLYKYGYVQYRLIGEKWIQEDLSEKYLKDRLPTNILGEIRYKTEPDISIEDKKLRIKRSGLATYQCITDQTRDLVTGCVKNN